MLSCDFHHSSINLFKNATKKIPESHQLYFTDPTLKIMSSCLASCRSSCCKSVRQMNKCTLKFSTRNEYHFPKINNFDLLFIPLPSPFVLFSYVNVMQSSFAGAVHITPHCQWQDAKLSWCVQQGFLSKKWLFSCVPSEAIQKSVSHEPGCVTACGPSHSHHHSLLSWRFIEHSLSITHPAKNK